MYNWASDDYEDDGIILGHKYVDLGLSVKWATCNVGATEPWEYGGYYAWGETEEKSKYQWGTYKWCNGNLNSITKYCTDSDHDHVDNKNVLDPEDDVAHVKWGGSWRMPTKDEIEELRDNCTWQWTTLNSVNGYKVTGPNGNSIFLPASGIFFYSGISTRDEEGVYLSSSLYEERRSLGCLYANNFSFSENGYRCSFTSRDYGYSVRPVSQ